MQDKRPNVILILVDDMGFADIGAMGSEIKTPNLDQLATDGMLFSSMYNCARCCPTRASLLTGLYPHRAGVGHMGAHLGSPEYQGYLRRDAVTIAEALQQNGYRTLMSGKWHVGGDYDTRRINEWRVGAPDRPTPRQRGFDRFYGIVDGVTHFFSPHYVLDDDTPIDLIPDNYYFTDAITDRAIGMIEESVSDERPFFLYLAHTAPHWPLHALPEDMAKYDGVYDRGWDETRTARHEEMLGRGVLQHPWEISPRDLNAPAWQDVEHTDWESMRMAAYAGMIDRVDQSIGRLLDSLKRLDQFEDTLILFLSDNGGCAEFMAEDGWAKWFPDTTHDGQQIQMGNRTDVRPGGGLTYMSYDLPWANVSNAPFRLYKHWVHEGGISTPLIAHWPAGLKASGIEHSACHVVDLLPTILAATNTPYPTEYGDHVIQPADGESLLSLMHGRSWERERPIFWEHEGNCAVRVGEFKLVREYGRPWELYNMIDDRTELNDLASHHRPMADKLAQLYAEWAQAAGVLPWEIVLPRIQAAWQMDDIHGSH